MDSFSSVSTSRRTSLSPSSPSKLVNGRRAYVGMTAWSPDGNRIAFVVYHDKALGGNADTLVSRVFIADLVESKVYNE